MATVNFYGTPYERGEAIKTVFGYNSSIAAAFEYAQQNPNTLSMTAFNFCLSSFKASVENRYWDQLGTSDYETTTETKLILLMIGKKAFDMSVEDITKITKDQNSAVQIKTLATKTQEITEKIKTKKASGEKLGSYDLRGPAGFTATMLQTAETANDVTNIQDNKKARNVTRSAKENLALTHFMLNNFVNEAMEYTGDQYYQPLTRMVGNIEKAKSLPWNKDLKTMVVV